MSSIDNEWNESRCNKICCTHYWSFHQLNRELIRQNSNRLNMSRHPSLCCQIFKKQQDVKNRTLWSKKQYSFQYKWAQNILAKINNIVLLGFRLSVYHSKNTICPYLDMQTEIWLLSSSQSRKMKLEQSSQRCYSDTYRRECVWTYWSIKDYTVIQYSLISGLYKYYSSCLVVIGLKVDHSALFCAWLNENE